MSSSNQRQQLHSFAEPSSSSFQQGGNSSPGMLQSGTAGTSPSGSEQPPGSQPLLGEGGHCLTALTALGTLWGGLHKSHRHRLLYLNALSSESGDIWEGLGGVTFLEEVSHWVWTWRFKKSMLDQVLFLVAYRSDIGNWIFLSGSHRADMRGIRVSFCLKLWALLRSFRARVVKQEEEGSDWQAWCLEHPVPQDWQRTANL